VSEPFRAILLCAVSAWAGALLLLGTTLALAARREGLDAAWALARRAAPAADLLGTWALAAAALALLLGREGLDPAWAGALLLVCLMFAWSLYDRAALLPSLDASWKRLSHAAERERWEREFAFLWRLAAWGRRATLLMAAGALACGALA
jgi:hypothetical protein